MRGPVALIILDGWGLAPEGPGNAVALARTPNFDAIWSSWPRTTLDASGEAVGLAAGQMGNSNVGHLNLGAGRVVYQDLTRIDRAIAEGRLADNPALRRVLEAARGARLHIWGLVSDGGVHSHMRHLLALLDVVAREGVETYVHAVLDGRDTAPTEGRRFIAELEGACRERAGGAAGAGGEDAPGDRRTPRIATVMGRYYAMDRDKRWDRVQKAYDAMVHGRGRTAPSAEAAVAAAYEAGETDEFVQPTVIVSGDAPVATIRSGDVALCFNFRADRARQLTAAFVDPEFSAFPREFPLLAAYGAMTEYDETLADRLAVLFPRPVLTNVLGEVVSRAGFRQLRIAETEKYAHVTYFFNGGEERSFEGEDRILVPSPKVATYDLQPEMSAAEVASRAAAALQEVPYRLLVVNFANPDMVGHTGSIPAAIRAVEAADAGLGVVLEAVRARDGAALVLADHGNAEVMIDPETGGPWTAHTTNPVPCVLVAPGYESVRLRSGGNLGDAAPTLLELMGLEQPPEMTGRSLIMRSS
ncbi:MAG: 2,3-bisphosphoglycerate-independent phosphoglycerate mutase [Clostridia bacterium]|nr:2,3-bisphosphoglycerate-independent phosphoglycerate mutase [Clostridia bacterium]